HERADRAGAVGAPRRCACLVEGRPDPPVTSALDRVRRGGYRRRGALVRCDHGPGQQFRLRLHREPPPEAILCRNLSRRANLVLRDRFGGRLLPVVNAAATVCAVLVQPVARRSASAASGARFPPALGGLVCAALLAVAGEAAFVHPAGGSAPGSAGRLLL